MSETWAILDSGGRGPSYEENVTERGGSQGAYGCRQKNTGEWVDSGQAKATEVFTSLSRSLLKVSCTVFRSTSLSLRLAAAGFSFHSMVRGLSLSVGHPQGLLSAFSNVNASWL